MNHENVIAIAADGNSNSNNTIKSPFPSIPDLDQPFTDQELEAIEAIEATLQSPPATSSSSDTMKRQSSSKALQEPPKTRCRRELPNSIIAPLIPKAFSPSPCQANLRRYPAFIFGGKILYGRTVKEVEKAATELLQGIEAKKREMGQVTLGFDIEWRPSFKKGLVDCPFGLINHPQYGRLKTDSSFKSTTTGVPPRKTAVMQICGGASCCYVMHIIHSGIPQSLQHLLQDSALLKVGAGIGNDCIKVFKEYNISIKEVEDLSRLANQKLGGSKQWGLKSLMEMLVCKELPKPKKIKLGNWEADFLSEEQLQYAATDAFASWHLYQVLKSLPDAADKRSEEPECVLNE